MRLRLKDYRAPQEHKKYPFIVIAQDTGPHPEHQGDDHAGPRLAGWACMEDHVLQVREWVRGQKEMLNVRIVDNQWRPMEGLYARYCIYVVRSSNHQALRGGVAQ